MGESDYYDHYDEYDDYSRKKVDWNYPNTKKTWNHQKISKMSISHIFNTANLITKKARVLFLIHKAEVERQGLTVEDSFESYDKWFEKKFPCYPTLLTYLSNELKENLGKV